MPDLTLRQCINDIPQRRQTLINLLRLIQQLPLHPTLTNLLTARQINQRKLRRPRTQIHQIILVQSQSEHHVGARGTLVHVCVVEGAVAGADVQVFQHLLGAAHVEFGHALDVDATGFVLTDFELWAVWVEQVADFLHVDLDYGQLSVTGWVLLCGTIPRLGCLK